MKLNWDLAAGIIYIGGFTGWALSDVGTMSGPSQRFGWELPAEVLLMLVPPLLFGYSAGRQRGPK